MDDGTHDHEDWTQKLRQALHPTMTPAVDKYGNAVEGHDYAGGQYNDINIRPANEMHVYSPEQQFYDMGAAGFVHAAATPTMPVHYPGPGEFLRAAPSSAPLGMMARSDLISSISI
jgi:hypothetical protein